MIINMRIGMVRRDHCTFWNLERGTDVSGVSGTGVPAVGVYDSERGCFLLVWSARLDEGFETAPSVQFHPHIANARRVHEHNGASRFVQVTDPEEICAIVDRIHQCYTQFWDSRDEYYAVNKDRPSDEGRGAAATS